MGKERGRGPERKDGVCSCHITLAGCYAGKGIDNYVSGVREGRIVFV